MSGQRAAMRRRQTVFRWVVVTLTLVFFGLPLFSMLEFTTRDVTGQRSGATWSALLDLGAIATRYPDLKRRVHRLDGARRPHRRDHAACCSCPR